jgi:hypothetical protein
VSRVLLRPVFRQCVHSLNLSDEDTGKVLGVVAFAGRSLYRLCNPTTLKAHCVRLW